MKPISQVLESILYTGRRVIETDAEAKAMYEPYAINRAMSWYGDQIQLANFMNEHWQHLDRRQQYDFYFYITRKYRRQFVSKPKNKIDDPDALEAVMTIYNYNQKRAIEVLRLLPQDQIDALKAQLDRGGIQR
jgi:hypothetical protein